LVQRHEASLIGIRGEVGKRHDGTLGLNDAHSLRLDPLTKLREVKRRSPLEDPEAEAERESEKLPPVALCIVSEKPRLLASCL
jgi:hypothetical protein